MDMLDGFTNANSQTEDHAQVNHFSDNFWGERNQGFDVLYHNMKHGQISVKDLQDFIKENANVEELYAKHMTKLAKQASNCSSLGTFSPLMEVLKVMTEKLSSCHMDIVLKMQDIVKELSKYFEEQKSKHKQMKEELSGTAEALHNLQFGTSVVVKSKEKYNQICIEVERLKRASAPPKDVEKAELKSKKAADEYKACVEKYATVRENFERKMVKSSQEFQRIEDSHLHHLKKVLENYILSFENANVLINQVHQEFRRQVNENTIDRLIQQYAEQKGTGTQRPAAIYFEEFDPTIMTSFLENGTQYNHTSSPENLPAATTSNKIKKETSGGIFGGGILRRRKPKRQETTTNSVGSKDSKDTESIESPDREPEIRIDEEGYTIRPMTSEYSDKNSFHFSSDSDSDSDSEDMMTRKIQVQIKPKDAATDSGGSDLETLNAITRNLTLGSPSPLERSLPSQSSIKKPGNSLSNQSTSEKMTNEDLMKLFSKAEDGKNGKLSSTRSSERITNSGDLRIQPNRSSENITSRKGAAPKPPITQTSSKRSDDDISSIPGKSIPDANMIPVVPPPRPPKPTGSLIVSSPSLSPSLPPNDLKFNNAKKVSNAGDVQTFSAPIASSESWSSLSSAGGTGTPTHTQVENFQSNFSSMSRGPSPLTLSHNDTIPIAVAFIENVNAYFRGTDESRSLTKITGEVQISFPAGITRAFTSNPNPALLSFRIQCPSQTSISNISHDTNLLLRDTSMENTALSYVYSFDMNALVNHVKRMTEKEPDSPYYNIHIISYQVVSSHQSMPLHVTSVWKCEQLTTDIKVDYKYNPASTSAALRNVNIIVPINGVVTHVQSTPKSIWNSDQNRLCWQIKGILQGSAGSGSLHSKLTMASGVSTPTTLAVQFLSDDSNLSGIDFELIGTGYRTSLIKKRFITGKYLSESS